MQLYLRLSIIHTCFKVKRGMILNHTSSLFMKIDLLSFKEFLSIVVTYLSRNFDFEHSSFHPDMLIKLRAIIKCNCIKCD